MENKTPKEIWIDANSTLDKMWLLEKRLDADIKYLSEASVNEMMAEKDKEIKRLKEEKSSLLKENKQAIHHLKVMLSASDGNLDAYRMEYGDSYPESEYSIKAKEFLKSIKKDD